MNSSPLSLEFVLLEIPKEEEPHVGQPPLPPPAPATHRHSKRSTPIEGSPQASTFGLPLAVHELLAGPRRPPSSSAGSGRSGSSRSDSASRSRERISPSSPLVADVQLARSRMIVTKRACTYNDPKIPFRSALIAFNVTIHTPPSTSSRVKDAQITLSFHGEEGGPAPVIKAISPTSSPLGPSSSVQRESGSTLGVSIGYDPFGSLNLSHTHSDSFTQVTQASVGTSGVETSVAWITLDEDPTTRGGVPPAFDFALLLHLPTRHLKFEVDLSVEASVGIGIEETWRRMMGSPREWRIVYDGETEMGAIAGGLSYIRAQR